MQRVPRILNVAVHTVVVLVAVGVAGVLLVPRLLGWETVTVLSGSMAPTYPTESVLAVDPVDPNDIRPGQVIAYGVKGPNTVTHRVVSVEGTGNDLQFVTKGDANDDPDGESVPASALRGRVVFGVPFLGWFVRKVHTPMGLALLLVVPALALMATQAATVRRELRSPKSAIEDSRS